MVTKKSEFMADLQCAGRMKLRELQKACSAEVIYTEHLSASIALNMLRLKLVKREQDCWMISTQDIIDDEFDISDLL